MQTVVPIKRRRTEAYELCMIKALSVKNIRNETGNINQSHFLRFGGGIKENELKKQSVSPDRSHYAKVFRSVL